MADNHQEDKNRQDGKMTSGTGDHIHIIRATHTDTTVRVYQAYNDQIAKEAVEAQSFEVARQKGLWSSKRMTWIKPSKVWMAYRCGWTVLKDSNQERVLAIDLDRTKFEELLAKATLSRHEDNTSDQEHNTDAHDDADGSKEVKKRNQRKKCRNASVVVQWDPERVMELRKYQGYTRSTPKIRSIQIGLRPPANECLLDPQVVKCITDVTEDFRGALEALQRGAVVEATALLWPAKHLEETPLKIPGHLRSHLNMSVDVVIVLGSTANPPHRGHLHCLEAARSRALQLGFNVLFTTIAVAPFKYVKSKMKNQANPLILDDEVRLKVLELTANSMEQEGSLVGFQTPTRTYGSALECGRALRPHDETLVMVVVGGDRFNWKKKSHPDVVTLCCARNKEQFATLQSRLQKDVKEGLVSDPSKWQLLSSVGPPISSTIVRSILQEDNQKMTREQKLQELLGHGYPLDAARLLLDE